MVLILRQKSNDFEASFKEFLGSKREVSQDVDDIVRAVIHQVRDHGDEALIKYSQQFDNIDLRETGIAISQADIETAAAGIDSETMAALQLAHDRIKAYHQHQLPQDKKFSDDLGVELGWRWTAVESVGLYVPGGTASYPSSVLMNAVPAKVAGVERLVMVVPTPNGQINPLVLAAAKLAGVDEVYRVGGAQAIAALAYGTKTIAPVAKIVGPGNAYVAAAKRQVFGLVGIDMIAGPSEVLVLADKNNNADWIAADLLAQAEHDVAAQSVLITDDEDFAKEVEKAVEAQLKTRKRVNIAAQSWRDFGGIILVDNFHDAMPLVNRFAAEHLELAVQDPEALLPMVRNAGAIFLGCYTPEVIGDYVGGSNHVLPTARSARFSSPLSVFDFMKRSSVMKLNAEQLRILGPAAIRIAEEEGLDGHAYSVSVRLNL
ncbi:histidinol dehydrogenase [Bartonella sp. HY329]|uniref:histidinol dehydrogenase n=1 Tax=unclassified Bartonella TaxID=2645622 RepID=UPI0021C600A8|nr:MULTISPECIES: histidinol dehydrogenase [unclassified Bartonella]UXM95011.1 histidinol dehydrogenase [Bartonella sp. HY329]UXN09334.1 histidinol dehydrogenase [Bartonella sp. HY328]